MKYVSLDIETTGLDHASHEIVEVGCILDDLEEMKPVEQLPYLRILVVPEHMEFRSMNVVCAHLHHDLWKEMKAADTTRLEDEGWYEDDVWGKEIPTEGLSANVDLFHAYITYPEYVQAALGHWLNEVDAWTYEDKSGYSENIGAGDTRLRVNIAGKNPTGFDIPFLRALPDWDDSIFSFRKRALDPASMFWRPGDPCLPNLTLCAERAGVELGKQHTSVADALTVLRLVRSGMLR